MAKAKPAEERDPTEYPERYVLAIQAVVNAAVRETKVINFGPKRSLLAACRRTRVAVANCYKLATGLKANEEEIDRMAGT